MAMFANNAMPELFSRSDVFQDNCGQCGIVAVADFTFARPLYRAHMHERLGVSLHLFRS